MDRLHRDRQSWRAPVWLTAAVLLLATGSPAADHGSGFRVLAPEHRQCLSQAQRRAIQAHIEDNVAQLVARGLLSAVSQKTEQVVLEWPLRPSSSLDDFGYHSISAYFDHDPDYPDQLRDFACGSRTYDWDNGYNHNATDFAIWPFSWLKMDRDEVEVVAAAAGIIVHLTDGNYDRSCGRNNRPANLVCIRHDDGSTAWYVHLKKGSLTTRQVGDRVAAGEYLGVVGSSGSSSGPHLHFELYDDLGEPLDPWGGECNSTTITSWWRLQRPHWDSAVLKLATHSALPEHPPCPEASVPHLQDRFKPGERVYFITYYRDQVAGMSAEVTVLRPDDLVFAAWLTEPQESYFWTYWWTWWDLPADAPHGLWTFRVVYNGQTYLYTFSVGEPAGCRCCGEPVYVAAAAHATGEHGSAWRTDLAVLNRSAIPATIDLRLLPRGGDGVAECVEVGTVAPRSSLLLADVVLAVLGETSANGGIAVYSSVNAFEVHSRTYQSGGGGTFGQAIPGRRVGEALASGTTGTLMQLAENNAFRTNVGFLNLAAEPTSVEAALYDSGGDLLGRLTYRLAPRAQAQVGRIFRRVTQRPISNGRVEVTPTGGPILAYASVIDETTGDPSYLEPR